MSEPHLRILAVNIFVRDQDRSLRFYIDTLGFQLAFDALLQTGDRWVAVAPPDGSALLALVEPSPESADYKMIGRRTNIVFVTDNVAAKYREWTKLGVRFRDVPRLRRVKYHRDEGHVEEASQPPVWGGIFTRFEDPDRNSFGLVSFDEVTEALEAQRTAAAKKLEAERRAAQELDIAKQVQAGLFPHHQPALETLEYASVCIQARQVGGDYYDFLDLGGGRLGLVIGDIAGKGIAAALLMANLQANMRGQSAQALADSRGYLQAVNRLFCANTVDSAYATLFFAEYDDASQRLRYINCGHLCALLLRHDGTLHRLESTGTVVGLFPQWDCTVGEQQLAGGDVLALYTDGITETSNDADEEFGEARLTAALRRCYEMSPQAILESVVAEVQGFGSREQHDDITFVVAKCRESN